MSDSIKVKYIRLRVETQHLLSMLEGLDWECCIEDSSHIEDIKQAISSLEKELEKPSSEGMERCPECNEEVQELDNA